MPSKTNKKSQSAHSSKKLSKSTDLNSKRPRESSEEPTYAVEKILDKKKIDGVIKYKVKWQGYSEEECTWEPAKHLDAVKEMIAEYNKQSKKKDNDEESEEKEKSAKEKNHKGKASKDKGHKGKNVHDKEEEIKEPSNKRNIGSPYKKVKTDEESNGLEPLKKTSYGHFKLGDKPSRIVHAKREKDEIIFKIEWEARDDGRSPLNTEMTGLELRKYDKDLLLDFYEERLKFVKPASKDSMKKSMAKEKMEEEKTKEIDKQDNQKMKEEETNETNRENEIVKSEVGNGVIEGKKEHHVIDLEDSPQEIREENNLSEVQGVDRSQMKTQEIGESQNDQSIYDSKNMIDNKGQQVFADVGFNVADDIRDLTLDPHLKVYSQTNQDLSKVGNEGDGSQNKPEPSELQIDSPKVSDSDDGSDESSSLDNILS